MRKWLAGSLIRLARNLFRAARRIYPPTVTEYPQGALFGPNGKGCATATNRLTNDSATYIAGPMGAAALAAYQRRESRGWY